MRIAAGIEYDGTAYNGWQKVETGLGVQAVVERALGRVANHEIDVVCAGRTDTGVHATGQVIHFDTDSVRDSRSWLLGANSNLPDDVCLTWVRPVDDAFHARYSASGRTYRYLILNRLVRSALHRHRAWWLHESLDHELMHEAGQALLGEHDFSAFRAAGCQARTPNRNLTAVIRGTSRRLAEPDRVRQCVSSAHGEEHDRRSGCDRSRRSADDLGRRCSGGPGPHSRRRGGPAARLDLGWGRLPG